MKPNLPQPKKRQRAQAMIEFALVFPLLIVLIYGIIEVGRLIAIWASVVTSSREAARYGASVGNIGSYRFVDCDGILGAARRSAILTVINNSNITISYDRGPGTTVYSNVCDPAIESLVMLGDRININVTITYEPILPVGFATFPVSSTASRTIIRGVEIAGDYAEEPGTPEVCFDAVGPDGSVSENVGEVYFNVVMDVASTETVIVPINLKGGNTASPGVDFTYSPTTVSIPPGDFSQMVTITILDETPPTLDEYDETFALTLGSILHANLCADTDLTTFSVTIADDDPPPDIHFETASSTVNEDGGSVSIPVLLSAKSGKDITFQFGLNPASTAVSGADFTLNTTPITIPAGQSGAVIIVVLQDDQMFGLDGTVVLDLTGIAPGLDGGPTAVITAPAQHVLTIKDTDPPPTVSFELSGSTTSENVGDLIIGLRMNRASSLTTVATVVLEPGGTATLGQDYNFASLPPLQVTFPAGEITAQVIMDVEPNLPDDEPPESFVLRIQSVDSGDPARPGIVGSPSQHIVTILESADEPTVQFALATQSVNESSAPVAAQVMLSNAWIDPVTVDVSVGGTADSATDYTPITISSVTIPAGAVSSAVLIPIIDDKLDEDNETVILMISNPQNATLAPPSQYTLTIIDNDDPPVVSFVLATSSYEEGSGAVSLQVILSTASARTITVSFNPSGSAVLGADYTLTTASPLTFTPGATTRSISLNIPDNDTYQGSRTVILTLSANPFEATVGAPNPHTLTIIENEVCPTLTTLTFGSDYLSTIVSLTTGAPSVDLQQMRVKMKNNQELLEVNLGGGSNLIFTGFVPMSGSYITLGGAANPWSPSGNRTLTSGIGSVLQVTFNDAIQVNERSQYALSLTWNNGCIVQIPSSAVFP